jgi:transposase
MLRWGVQLDPAELAELPPKFAALFTALMERVEKLESENAVLKAENAELKRRLGMNSTNSSKPPSTDSLTKPKKPERREGSAKRSGKRRREGRNRNDFGSPDRIEPVRPETCPDCRVQLSGDGVLYDRRQVAELVEKPFIVTEFQMFRRICPCCGKQVEAPVPEGTLPGFSLGPRLVAFIGVLDHFGNVPHNKIETILHEGFNLPICEGTIDNANRWLHAGLAAPVAELKEILPTLSHAHADETGWRVDGAKRWVWTVATENLTFIEVAASRGTKVLLGLLSGAFAGLISCDFWSAYRTKDGVGGERAYCWSHLDREAKGIIDNGRGKTAEFGRALRFVIHWGYIHWRGLKRGRITAEVFRQLGERLRQTTRETLAAYAGKLAGKKAKALHKRLVRHLEGYFNWYDQPGVSPDNNLAERAIRPVVVNRKVSGGNRSEWGGQLTSYMQTVLGTCRKQGRPILETLKAYLLAFAHPGLSYPSLIPASSGP